MKEYIETDIRHPDITVQLSGTDSNAGALMGMITNAIKQARRDGDLTPEEARTSTLEFRREAMSGDYDHLLQTCMKWVNVE